MARSGLEASAVRTLKGQIGQEAKKLGATEDENEKKHIMRRARDLMKRKDDMSDEDDVQRAAMESRKPINFNKMKLVSEMLASGTGTALSSTANQKASQAAQAGKQVSNTQNNSSMQQTQMATKAGKAPQLSPVVQKTQTAATPTPVKTGPQAVVSHFDALRDKKDFVKQLHEKSSNWRTDLKEALGKDDEVFHPYVEVMPFKDFKQKEAKKNLKMQAMKDGAAENPTQKMAKASMVVGEQLIKEKAYVQPEGAERKKAEKEKKIRQADAAKAAARHARITKGIPFSDAKGRGYIKNGQKTYETNTQ